MLTKILYVLSSDRHSTEALHWCLHKAKEDTRLLRVVYVSQPQEHAKQTIEEIERQCRTFQIKFETDIFSGSYLDACLTGAKKSDVKILAVVEEKKCFIKNLFSRKDITKLVGLIPCELKVYPPD